MQTEPWRHGDRSIRKKLDRGLEKSEEPERLGGWGWEDGARICVATLSSTPCILCLKLGVGVLWVEARLCLLERGSPGWWWSETHCPPSGS